VLISLFSVNSSLFNSEWLHRATVLIFPLLMAMMTDVDITTYVQLSYVHRHTVSTDAFVGAFFASGHEAVNEPLSCMTLVTSRRLKAALKYNESLQTNKLEL